MACTQVQVCCCDPDAARIYFPASVLCQNACKIYYLLYGYETCERSCAGAECRLVVFLNKSSLYLDFVSVHLWDVKSARCTWTLVMYKGVYIFMWLVSSESRAFTCGHMAAEAFGSLNQQHVFFGVGSMHMVSREAAGLKAEAVVGYVREKDEGKETWWIPPPPHPTTHPRRHFVSGNTWWRVHCSFLKSWRNAGPVYFATLLPLWCFTLPFSVPCQPPPPLLHINTD